MSSEPSRIETSPTEPRTATGVAPRYSRYLAGYLALTVVGTIGLLVLAKRSSHLLAAVEVLVAGGVLAAASVGAIAALYRDAVGLAEAGTRWNPDWKPYVAFAVGTPVAVYLAIAYVTVSDVALLAAGVAFVGAAFEAAALYLYRRFEYVGTPA
ncbi:hypothetical protein [Halorussus sp. AFM4]|uniref:hypothetical protein n=1 Tax=Halorussus sp. AFM4 TaxID=3421651 RepID=UPI003EBCF830